MLLITLNSFSSKTFFVIWKPHVRSFVTLIQVCQQVQFITRAKPAAWVISDSLAIQSNFSGGCEGKTECKWLAPVILQRCYMDIFTTFGCVVAILAYAQFVVITCTNQEEQGSGLRSLLQWNCLFWLTEKFTMNFFVENGNRRVCI